MTTLGSVLRSSSWHAPAMAALLAIATRFIGYRLVDFGYNPFRDGLDWARLLLDVGIYAVLFTGFLLALTRVGAWWRGQV